MPWRCPACQIQIHHSEIEARPRTDRVYRCHVCRLELKFDAGLERLTVLPVEAAPPQMVSPQSCILVVDDFEDGRELLAEYLTFQGHTVIQAASGETALSQARLHQPRLILLDIAMPGMDGLEVARRLRADPRTKDAILIAVTARAGMFSAEAEALAAGCDAFVPKPYVLPRLGDAVEAIMRDGRSALGLIAGVYLNS